MLVCLDQAAKDPARKVDRPRPTPVPSSVSSSVGSLPGGVAAAGGIVPANAQPRGRSHSISTTTESSLPSPPNSTADLPSPPARLPTESPPPTTLMSASLGRLDGAAMARAGLSADADFASASAAARAKKGQKRHSISGGSSGGFPHLAGPGNPIVLKAPTAKKKARFEQAGQPPFSRPAGHPSYSLSDLPRPLTALSASVPVSSPISIRPPGGGVAAATGDVPCSRCAELLPLRSASVPMSEDPICDRCADAPGQHHHLSSHGAPQPPRRHGHQRAFSSSSVPVRSSMAAYSSTFSGVPTPLESWDSGDEDYEIVTRPSSPVQPQPRKLQAGWSLEEEFSFLDTVDSDDEAAPPAQPTLAGWGGPFFRNMPMPPPKLPSAVAQHTAAAASAQAAAAAAAAVASYPSPVSSFLGYQNGHQRSSTSSPSSASSQSPFPSNLPTPGGDGHHGPAGLHLLGGNGDYPGPASPITDGGSLHSLSQRRGLGSAKLHFGNPSAPVGAQGFIPAGTAPSSGRVGKPPPITTLFSHPTGGDLEFLVRAGPPSPIVFGSNAMRRTHSGTGASVLGLGGTSSSLHQHHHSHHHGLDDHHMTGQDVIMSDEVEMEDLQ
jgi:hypothetical protein